MKIVTAMSREEVESSNVKEIGYDPETKVLEILFKSGGIYQYFDVPSMVYDQMMGSVSKGKFLHQNIKGEYRYEKVAG